MKHIINIFTFIIIASCGQTKTEKDSNIIIENKVAQISDTTYYNENQAHKEATIEETENYRKQSLSGFEKATLYRLTDTITADFNGDGIIDKAFYQKENQNSGIIIKHGKTNEIVEIGFGKKFAHMTEFDWVNYWGLVEDKETQEITFSEEGDVIGSKDVKLLNPSIVLGADESGGGLITFINGKYVWIHQTC